MAISRALSSTGTVCGAFVSHSLCGRLVEGMRGLRLGCLVLEATARFARLADRKRIADSA